MSENNKKAELKDEELEKVTGGVEYCEFADHTILIEVGHYYLTPGKTGIVRINGPKVCSDGHYIFPVTIYSLDKQLIQESTDLHIHDYMEQLVEVKDF